MDGLNLIGVDWRPDRQPEPPAVSAASMVRHAAGALAVFAAIMLATLGGILLMDRLGVPLPVLEVGAGP